MKTHSSKVKFFRGALNCTHLDRKKNIKYKETIKCNVAEINNIKKQKIINVTIYIERLGI